MRREFESLLKRDDISTESKKQIHRIKNKYDELKIELERAESSFQELTQRSSIIIFEIDLLNGKFLYVNDFMCTITGYTKKELLAKNPLEIFPQGISKHELFSKSLELEVRTKSAKISIWIKTEVQQISDELNRIIKARFIGYDITDEIYAKKAQKESEERYHKLFDSFPHLIVIIDLNGTIIKCNNSVAKFVGIAKEKIIGKHLSKINIIHKDGITRYKKLISDLLKESDNKAIKIELFDCKKKRHILEIYSSILEKDGENYAIQIIGYDITVQRRLKKNLSESEKRCQALSEASFEGIIIHDKGVILEANEAYANQLGYKVSELIGKNGLEHAASESRELILKNILNGYEEPYEAIALRKDGSTFPVEIRGKNINYFGKKARATAFYDITKRKKAEEAIKESEEKYRTVITAMSEGIWVSDKRNNTLLVNPALEKMLGYSKEELQAKPVSYFLSEESVQILDKKNNERYNKRILSDRYELILIRKNGKLLTSSIAATALFDPEHPGNPIGSLAIVSDISKQKEIEKTRKELESRRAQFMALVFHELRTLLTNIKGFIELINTRESFFAQEEKKKCFEVINNNISRLERLINGVSELNRIERGFFELKVIRTDILKFLINFLKPYTIMLGNQFELNYSQGNQPIFVDIDPERLSQALDNIIQNAIKHTPEDGRQIVFTCTAASKKLEIIIKDNGAGILPENRKRIFQSFVSIPTKYSAQGTGIGLYLAKFIVEAHKGKIKAFSDGLDKGTTFKIFLPLNKK